MKTALRKLLPLLLCLILCICLAPAAWAEDEALLIDDTDKFLTTEESLAFEADIGESLSFTAAGEIITVTFNANGGTGTMAAQEFVKGDPSKPLNFNTFTRDGYTFLGWNERADGSAADGRIIKDGANFRVPETYSSSKATLYAQWEEIITEDVKVVVSFHANGGTGYMEPQNIECGQSAMLNANTFIRTNYAFSHWNTRADGSGENYANQGDIIPTGSLTLYAQWVKIAYSVYYDKNGGGGSMAPVSINKWSAGTVKSNAFNAPNYSLVFAEWNTRPDGSGESYQPGDIIRSDSVPSDITLYAIWRDKVTVWFYPGAGDGTAGPRDVPKGGEVKLPSASSLGYTAPAGQTFAGWQIEGEDRLYKSGETYIFNTEKKVVAQWDDTITITYDPNGATASSRKLQRVAKNNPIKLASMEQIGYTRTGFAFKGWALTPGAKDARWEDAAAIVDGFSADMTLYAVWEQHIFTGVVSISGSLSIGEDIGYVGETLTATVTGEKVFTDYSFQWMRDGVPINGATAETYAPTSADFNCIITCDVTANDALEGKTRTSINHKYIYIDTSDKIIVNNGQAETDYVYGVIPGMYYSVNNGAKQRVVLSGGAFPVTQQGVYRFYKDASSNVPVATVNVVNWWTIGYNLTAYNASGTVTFKRGSTTLSGSTTIRDSAGNTVLRPYNLSGYTNVWIVREDAGITDLSMTVKPSSGSYSYVSLNGGSYSSSNTERIFNLGSINCPILYDVIFLKPTAFPRFDTGLFLPDFLVEIEPEAFAGGAFENVRIPAAVTEIGSRAFEDCHNLKFVEIMGSITKIDSRAFADCLNLHTIVIRGTTTRIAPDAFYGTYGITIYAPLNSSAAAFANEHGIDFYPIV